VKPEVVFPAEFSGFKRPVALSLDGSAAGARRRFHQETRPYRNQAGRKLMVSETPLLIEVDNF
jgi:hypothetical protein